MDRATWKAEIKPLVAPVILPLVFFWRELLGLSVFGGFDFTSLILPFQQFARESLWRGTLPHWNPYLFAGFPQIAEGEGGLFYPGNMLLWLPVEQAVLLGWTVVLHLILTGCLMYGFLRGRGISRAAAGWMSVLYQLLPGLLLRFETVGLFQAVTWLPGFYWACERAVEAASEDRRVEGWIRWAGFASIQIAFMLLAGSSQIAFYAMVGAVFYLAGVAAMGPFPLRRTKWAFATFLVAGGWGMAMAAVQLMPTAVLAGLSHRIQWASAGYYRLGTWLTLPRLASLFMFPAIRSANDILDYVSSLGYIGFLPFLLVGVALSVRSKRMNPILPPLLLAFFGVLLAFGLNFALYRELVAYPGFNLFRALGRMILPTQVGLLALAAEGLDALMRLSADQSKRRLMSEGAWAMAAAAAILLGWHLLAEGFPLSRLQVVGLALLGGGAATVVVCLFGYFRTRKPIWLIALLTIWVLSHFAAMLPARAVFTMDRSFLVKLQKPLALKEALPETEPVRPPRVLVASQPNWAPILDRLSQAPFSSASVLPSPAYGNTLTLAEIGVLAGYTPLIPHRWHEVAREYASRGLGEVSDASERLRRVLAIACVDATIAPDTFIGGEGFIRPDVDLYGLFPPTWHLLTTPPAGPYAAVPRYVEAWSEMDWGWFKHWIVQPGYVPGEWVCVEIDKKQPLPEDMEWSTPVTQMLDTDPRLPVWGGARLDAEAGCDVVSVERNCGEIIVRARCDSACWLVVRESYMPGWEVSIDGKKGKVYCADYLFCGVPLPAGEHTVEMVYITPGLKTGAALSFVGWGIWIAAMVAAFVIRRRKLSDSRGG